MNTRVAPVLAPTSISGQRDAHAMSLHATGDGHAASIHEDGPDALAASTHEDDPAARAASTREDGPAALAASTHEDGTDAPAASIRDDHSDGHAAPMREEDPDVLARTVGDAMYAADEASRALGMRLDDIGPGRARLTMRVRPDMLNGHRTCHGGFIFSLADSAFAFACNSRNVSTVASGCTIDFLAPAREGDVLTATAHERSLAGRTGIYDITVCNEDGHAVAVFRGRSYRIKGQIVGE